MVVYMYVIIVLFGLLGGTVGYGLRLKRKLEARSNDLENKLKEKENTINKLNRLLDDQEREVKLSKFRVGSMFNALDYIRKIKNTEDPKHYLGVAANLAEDAINKCKMTVQTVGERMAHF